MLVFRWHRIGISVKNDEITLIFDCETNDTLPLQRTKQDPSLDTDGIIFLGRQLVEQDIFTVSSSLSLSLCLSCLLIQAALSSSVRGVAATVASKRTHAHHFPDFIFFFTYTVSACI
jgi:hypothetical protein